jgi:hypothetical protein
VQRLILDEQHIHTMRTPRPGTGGFSPWLFLRIFCFHVVLLYEWVLFSCALFPLGITKKRACSSGGVLFYWELIGNIFWRCWGFSQSSTHEECFYLWYSQYTLVSLSRTLWIVVFYHIQNDVPDNIERRRFATNERC